MLQLSPCIREKLSTVVPASIINDVTCFTFYDSHPYDKKTIDVIVCTTAGEILELYQRDTLSKGLLNTISKPIEICIYRNSKITLYYLVSTAVELFIFCRKENIKLLRKFDNVERFVLDDPSCSGQALLRFWYHDDAVPLVLNEDFENLSDTNSFVSEEKLPVVNMLKSKLIEAKYTLALNEIAYKDLLKLRQIAAFSTYCDMYPELKTPMSKVPFKEAVAGLKIKLSKQSIKQCNNKIVIIFNILNNSYNSIHDIDVILHCDNKSTTTYERKLYDFITDPPHWKESNLNYIPMNDNKMFVVVVDKKELIYTVCDKIQLKGSILYKLQGKQKVMPLDEVDISHLNAMDIKFDVLSSSVYDTSDILAVIATSIKTDLVLRHIHHDCDIQDMILGDVLCVYLNMEQVSNNNNIIIHRSSPYHVLNGVMVVIEENNSDKDCFKVTVFSRCQSQVLALVHYIYDAVPYRLLVILHKAQVYMRNKTDPKRVLLKGITDKHGNEMINLLRYGESLTNQMAMVLKFYDDCIMKMGECKNQEVLNMIGSHIDLLAFGSETFLEFNANLSGEILKGIDCLCDKSVKKDDYSDVAVIDDDDW